MRNMNRHTGKEMHSNLVKYHVHENKDFAPGIIISPQKFSWLIMLYTTSCLEFSPMNILGQNFYFQAWK